LKKVDQKTRDWMDARKRHRLTDVQVAMARALGMQPRSLGKLDNDRQEPWKLPLAEFIEDQYVRRFGRVPEKVPSLEEQWKRREQKKQEKRERKALRRAAAKGTGGPIAGAAGQ
jgi:hypothetical protein